VIRLSVGGFGVNVFRPVYRDGAPTRTVAQRRAALIGFATGAFQSADIGRALADSLPDEFEAQVLEGGRTVIGEPISREEASTAPIRIADRAWLLAVRDPARPTLTLPILMAVLGLSISFLLVALVLIWSRSERMHELALQASQDPLTGLKNRRRFEEELRTELARAGRQSSEGALMIIDVDDFKRVNDTRGHPAGDRVIQGVADVLRRRARETDVLARVGGDEFAVVLPHCSLGEAERVAAAISEAIDEHVHEDGEPPVTASIGIAMFGEGGRVDFESVQQSADAAMYEAKQAGRSEIRIAGRDLESA
jgi:diguanylate cyclase (GGDEF)-like protein